MSEPSVTEEVRSDGTLIGDTRALAALAPRQFSDEFTLAKRELKAKGISAGVGAALFAAVLVVLGLMVIALVVAAIMGLATVMPAWLAALIVAAFFLLIIAICAFLGLRYFKRALPPTPQEALRGLRHDLGVLREGSSFDPASLDAQDEESVEAEEGKTSQAEEAKESKPAPPSDEELRQRIQDRRDHLLRLRDDLGERADVKAQFQSMLDDPDSGVNQVRRRWMPWSVAAVSTVTFVVLLRKLIKS